MPTLDATVGGTDSNSYITVADATTYFDERLKPVDVWTNASSDDQIRALITSTRRLDAEDWEGVKVTTGQALDWPRYSATDEDGEEYDNAVIPQVVKDATCETALALLVSHVDGVDKLADTGLEPFDAAKVGPMDMEKDKSFTAGQLPAQVRRMLSAVLTTSGNTVRLQRA